MKPHPLVSVKFSPIGRTFSFAMPDLDLDALDEAAPEASRGDAPRPARGAVPLPGEKVIVQTDAGPAFGTVISGIPAIRERKPPAADAQVVRRATKEDVVARFKHEQREQEAHRIAILKIRERQLPMKLARVEQLFDGSRLIFYYTAEGRVDFRELVRDLAAHFHVRIEMRQIGARDEAQMVGGYGVCGRPLCCTTWLTSFEPISIKMAKQQNLSLNPSKLSGMCGRLKCCLRYELPNGKGVKRGGCADEGGVRESHWPRLRFLRLGRLRVLPAVSLPPRVAITAGDPAGIGPEIALRAASDPEVRALCEPVIYGASSPGELAGFARGRVSAEAGRAAYDAIVRAVHDASNGGVAAIATAPINKEAFAAAGLPWKGHTDLLAHLTGAARGVMMFHSEVLRVVLATVHIPLAQVPSALTQTLLEDVISLTASELPRFGVPRPRLAVAGLNPHAGENGVLGTEDDRVLRPAVQACAARGIDVRGPFPADTIFLRAMRGEFDVVVACYHDQGLIPVKMAAFGKAVNVTLGLPIIRTSVDHGTAFDIAGRGVADPSSMIAAVKLAARLAGVHG